LRFSSARVEFLCWSLNPGHHTEEIDKCLR